MSQHINLEFFKKILLEEKEKILHRIREISDELARISEEDEINNIEDLVELKIANDRDQSVLKVLIREFKDVNDALKKIEAGQYGIDEETGQMIPLNRLLANPAARTA